MTELSSPAAAMKPLLSPELPPAADPLRAAITAAWVRDESEHVRELLAQATQPDTDRAAIQATAADLVRRVRARAQDQGAIEAFMALTLLSLSWKPDACAWPPNASTPATASARAEIRETWICCIASCLR